MSASTSGRLRHLDGLRGIAAIAVLYQHLVEYLGTLAPGQTLMRMHMDWTLDYLNLGKLGVVLFFAISGYIVPFSFGAESPRMRFVISRFFRLYPAYWLSLLAAALLLPIIGNSSFSAVQLVANLTMVQTLFGQPDVLGVYWTLLIELIFYALCFMLHVAGLLHNPRALRGLFVLMLGLALIGALARQSGHDLLPVSLPLYLAVMLWGSTMRLATLEGDPVARRHGLPMLVVMLVVIPLAWSIAYEDHSHKESVLADASAFVLALLCFVVVVRQRMFASAPLVYFGAISYSIYLFHPLALEIASFLASRSFWPINGLVLAAAALSLTLLASHVVHRWVEQPSIQLGRRLARFLAPSRVAPSLHSS